MAQLNNLPNTLKAKWPQAAGIGVIIVLVVAAIAFAQYRAQATQPSLESAASQVSISQPLNGTQVVALEPITIDATAIGPFPFTSMELWLNGELMGVQGAPSQGKTPFSTSFAWLPQDEGAFSFVARAVDENGQTSTSPAVLVNVGAAEESAEIDPEFADSPAVYPSAGGYAAPRGPGANDSIGDAEDWNGSPGDWVNSLTNDDPPAAPELAVHVDELSCVLTLNIHDLSDNEEGFRIYRNDTTSGPTYKQIATLTSQSQNEWITYDEDVWALGYIQANYYVVAFNSQGESQSNIVYAFLDTVDCLVDPPEDSPQFNDILAIQLQGLHVLNTAPPDQLYCYRSINGGLWVRWPASDYFYPLPDGSFSLNEVLNAIFMEMDSGPMEQSISLDLECWGWYGDDVEYLGSLHHSPDQQLGLGDFSIIGDALSADLVLEQLSGDGPFYQFSGDLQAEFVAGVTDFVLHSIIDPQMQPPAAYVTHDPEECTNHLPPDAQNLLGTILFCFPYPGFHGGLAEGDNPQPYLVWNFFNHCNAGFGLEQDGGACKSYQNYLDEAAANGTKIGFIIHDWSSAGYQQWIVEAPHLRMLNIPPNGCTGNRTFRVVMFHEQESFTQYSPNSNDFTIPCPKPVGNVVTLDLIFESLTLHNLDDGDSGQQDVEVFGYFQVMAPSSQLGNNNYLQMGAWDEQYSECPDDTDFFTGNVPGGCTQVFVNGTHSLYDVPLCKSSSLQTDKYHCYRHLTANHSVQDLYQTNNNRLRIEVQDGDGINLAMTLKDWDDASANDLVCFGFSDSFADGMDIFEWDAMDGEGFALIGFGDDGMTCSVSGVFHVVD